MLVHGHIWMFYIVHWCLKDATYVRLNWFISCTILMRGDRKRSVCVQSCLQSCVGVKDRPAVGFGKFGPVSTSARSWEAEWHSLVNTQLGIFIVSYNFT